MPYELLEDDEPQESSLLSVGKESARHLSRTVSNVATMAVGLPGDIFSLVNEFIAKPVTEGITGKKGLPYEETPLGKLLPTTETHRKNIEPLTGEFLKPQNKVEKFADEVVEDTAALMNPAKIVQKGIKTGAKVFRNFAKSIGANFAGETTKQVSGNENSGTYTKAGSLFLLSLLDQEAAAKQVAKLYTQAEANLPANAKTGAVNLANKLNNLETQITKKRPIKNLSPPEKFVVDQIRKVNNLIKKGEISVEQAVAQKRSLNKELATLYKEVPKGKDQKTVKNMAKQINGFLNETIEEYGKKNKKFYGPYKDADQAFGTLANSNFISKWVEGNVVQHPITTGLMHLFAPAASAAAIAVAPYQAIKLTYRIANSPTLAKIYAKTTAAAAREDAIAFNKYLKELDQALQQEESKDRYEFID